MDEPGRLPACELPEERSSVLLAFGKDDDDWPKDAPLVPMCSAVAFI